MMKLLKLAAALMMLSVISLSVWDIAYAEGCPWESTIEIWADGGNWGCHSSLTHDAEWKDCPCVLEYSVNMQAPSSTSWVWGTQYGTMREGTGNFVCDAYVSSACDNTIHNFLKVGCERGSYYAFVLQGACDDDGCP